MAVTWNRVHKEAVPGIENGTEITTSRHDRGYKRQHRHGEENMRQNLTNPANWYFGATERAPRGY